jgi:hypothetical protein
LLIHFIAIGGSGVKAKAIFFEGAAATGTQQVTSVGFSPDVLFFVGAGPKLGSPPSQANLQKFQLGVADSNGEQWAIGTVDNANKSPTQTRRLQSNAAIYVNLDATPKLTGLAAWTQMLPQGFELNWSQVSGTGPAPMIALALRGVEVSAGGFTKSGNGGTQAVPLLLPDSGTAPFTPGLVLLASDQGPDSTSLLNANRLAFGASDALNMAGSSVSDEDGATSTEIEGVDDTSFIFASIETAGATQTASQCSILPFTNGKFVLHWFQNNGGDSTDIHYLALGAHVTRSPGGPADSGGVDGGLGSGAGAGCGCRFGLTPVAWALLAIAWMLRRSPHRADWRLASTRASSLPRNVPLQGL